MYEVDNLVIGAGIFGCHAATVLSKNGKTMVVEQLSDIINATTRWNHGRVHNGLHYLNDYETAKQANDNYQKFILDNVSAINNKFEHLYAIDSVGSKSNKDVFENTANNFGIKYARSYSKVLKHENLEAAYSLEEPTFDILELKRLYGKRLSDNEVDVVLNSRIIDAEVISGKYVIKISNSDNDITTIIVNKTIMIAAYNQTNDVLDTLGLPKEDITYVLGRQAYAYIPNLKNIGLTVVDGQFISLSPFGFSELHAINSPLHSNFLYTNNLHEISECHEPSDTELLDKIVEQSSRYIDASNIYMHSAKGYVKALFDYSHNPESRKTSIKKVSSSPDVYTIISGKISNIYEVDKLEFH